MRMPTGQRTTLARVKNVVINSPSMQSHPRRTLANNSLVYIKYVRVPKVSPSDRRQWQLMSGHPTYTLRLAALIPPPNRQRAVSATCHTRRNHLTGAVHFARTRGPGQGLLNAQPPRSCPKSAHRTIIRIQPRSPPPLAARLPPAAPARPGL